MPWFIQEFPLNNTQLHQCLTENPDLPDTIQGKT